MRRRISLRLRVLIAFLIVFAVSYSVIIFSFQTLVAAYIETDATQRVQNSIRQARTLAAATTLAPEDIDEAEKDAAIYMFIEALISASDADVALISKDYALLWPDYTDIYHLHEKASLILESMEAKEIPIGTDSVKEVTTRNLVPYYIASIEIRLPDVTHEDEAFFILFYLDVSPYYAFSANVHDILYAILVITLLMSLAASLLVSNSVIRSINRLNVFAERIGTGHFECEKFNFIDKELSQLSDKMNRMAEHLGQADKEEKLFFQNASHELRTPLMSIQGYAEGIKYGVFDNTTEAADIIISESARLTMMVENLLTISRLDTALLGKNSIPKETLCLQHIIRSTVEKIQGLATMAEIGIDLDLPDIDIDIVANENDMIRALMNILSNALRYAQTQINIYLRNEKDEAIVRISDDGLGIGDDLIDRVFDRFTKSRDGKYGIGLSLVNAIIRDHKGSIRAFNRTGEESGAVFEIRLPVQPPD